MPKSWSQWDSQRRELKNSGLYVEEGFIKHIGPNEELPATADTVIDLSGQIVLPGFVNTHHHLNQTLTRNLAAAQNNNLFPWLQAQYRIWARTTEEASRASTLNTTVFDHTYVFKNGSYVLRALLSFLQAVEGKGGNGAGLKRDLAPEPAGKVLKGEVIGLVKSADENVRRSGIGRYAPSVDGEEGVGSGEGRPLVAVEERVVLR
jgi:hypothetical protein